MNIMVFDYENRRFLFYCACIICVAASNKFIYVCYNQIQINFIARQKIFILEEESE